MNETIRSHNLPLYLPLTLNDKPPELLGGLAAVLSGTYWIRTSDLMRVKHAL